ncbi:TlpA family protein disulfide reductase [Nonomuraea sp. 10N515B]|uniref:TlpA family protein disulfide reductase n=1 Tax=Nonomuraea sp. 10N515B TaxID=3457422 RepID=UPI003FCE5F80
MPFLVAAVVFLGVLCLFNLVLMLALLRRLREHTAELGRLAGHSMLMPYDPRVLVGRALPEAAAGARLVGFFDVGCSTCHERAPEFAEAAGKQPALAVVNGDGAKVDDLVAVVGGVSNVITGDEAGRIVRDLGVEAFPTFLRVDQDGRVVAADTELAELTAVAPAA